MRALIQAIYTNPKYANAFEWGKLVTITGGAQITIQVIALLGGILTIRLLPTQEYAYYTIANTMLGTMAVLADGGIAIGVMATGGKVWNNYQKLGTVISTGLNLRKAFALVSFSLVTPVVFFLLDHHGANILVSSLIILSLLPAFLTTIYGTLLQIPLKLHQSIKPLQKNQLENSIIRLIILSLSVFIFPWAGTALLASGIPQIQSNKRLKKLANAYADLQAIPDKLIRAEIMVSVKRILPDSIYYCLSGQLTIWLISIFGQTSSIAQAGALSRFNASLSVLTLLYSTLVVPRFARLSEDKLLIGFFIKVQILLAFVCIGIVSCSWLFSDKLLSILGENYSHLESELTISIIGGCTSILSGVAFGLYSCRGFAIRPIILIPINIIATIVGIFIFDYSTLSGILLLNVFLAGVQLVIHLIYGFLKVKSISKSNY
ncbi:lipopolysaccharide biosynthesis protein [Spirosoma agri]|uniref:Polysaccharide biosynthesis protein n=1 Tax=Spirosoma agri TaxID=1987381 RepID=A0A6M0IGV9_9BACT|nr:polysaccharide biosynthesis protein [Spirosoma agri]NEU67438.1 polysaccharide biosynthesis protein [Spirosoma agri]